MWDFLSFRRMLIPYLVQILFWCGTAACIFFGVMILTGKATFHPPGELQVSGRVPLGLLVMLAGPLALRLWCEMTIVVFRINETLTEMSGSRGGKK